MVPSTISTRTIQRTVLVLIALCVVVAIGWGVVYFITHGRIVVKTPEGVAFSSLSYCLSSTCNTSSDSSSASVTAGSGSYVVQVFLANNTSYVTNVVVKGFLQTTTIEAKSKKYTLSTISATSNQYILPVNDGYVTYDPDGSAYSTTSSSAIPVKQLVTAQYVDANKALFVEYITPTRVTSVSQQVLLYNTTSHTYTPVGVVNDIDSSKIIRGNTVLYAFKTGDSSTASAITTSGITSVTIPDGIPYALHGTVPIFNGSGRYYALVSGNDYMSRSDGNEERTTNPSVLTLYDKSFKEVRKIQLGVRSDISNISFSADGSKIVLVCENMLLVYDTESGEKSFETKAQLLNGSSIIWRNNDSFIYQLGTGGVYMATISTKEAYSILDNSLLRITDISAVIDDMVYITAFPNKSDNYERVNPSGYTINLGRDATNTASVQTDSILRYLPYDGMTYSIGYRFTNESGLVLDITSNEGSRNSAVQKIVDLGFDPGDYTLVFTHYASPFVQQTGVNQ